MTATNMSLIEQLRYGTAYGASTLLAGGMAMDFGTHEFAPGGRAIPELRSLLENVLTQISSNEEVSNAITIHIGNFGWSAVGMVPFALGSEFLRIKGIREDSVELKHAATFLALAGLVSVGLLNFIIESFPSTTQTNGDTISGVIGAYLILHTIQGINDDIMLRRANQLEVLQGSAAL